ncbi:MAG: hypothetical protein ACOCVF_00085 [bacterium]
MCWKQVKIFTADAEQSAMIESNPEKTGICLHSIEEDRNNRKSFILYMSYDEARAIGRELIKYADENEKVKS